MKYLEPFHFAADIAIIGSAAIIAGNFLAMTNEMNRIPAFLCMLSGAILLLVASVATFRATKVQPVKWEIRLLEVGIIILFLASALWIVTLFYPIILNSLSSFCSASIPSPA